MINSCFLFNDLNSEGPGNIQVDDFKPVRNASDQNFPPILDASNVVELKAINRMISLIYLVFHNSNHSRTENKSQEEIPAFHPPPYGRGLPGGQVKKERR